jgi:hypothetical protein
LNWELPGWKPGNNQSLEDLSGTMPYPGSRTWYSIG